LLRQAGAQSLALEVDVADEARVAAMAQRLKDSFGRIDILINNAGIATAPARTHELPVADWDRLIAINLGGPVHLTQALLPPMIAAGKGKIVNVASDAGRVGSTGETVYAAAKGGVIAFTKSLAREVARYAINVNCVCPGPTDTPMLATRPEKMREAFIKAIPFRRFAKPQEIADAILFFASSRSDYITGQVLSISGGLTFAG